MRATRALAAPAAAALLMLLAAAAGARAQVATKVVHVPAAQGSNAKVEVHVVQEKGRHPNGAPRPPVTAAALAGAGIATFPATGTAPCGGAQPCAAGVAPVVTPAAQLGAPVQAITGPQQGGNVPMYTMGLQTKAGAKIVGVDDKCGCPGQAPSNPCDNPCKPTRTVADEIESRLTDVKNEIVNRAQKLQADNVWVKQVKDVIQHYNAKIQAVGQSNTQLKGDIKRLFAKKKHYEDLLMQYSLDRDHFNRVVKQQAVESK